MPGYDRILIRIRNSEIKIVLVFTRLENVSFYQQEVINFPPHYPNAISSLFCYVPIMFPLALNLYYLLTNKTVKVFPPLPSDIRFSIFPFKRLYTALN